MLKISFLDSFLGSFSLLVTGDYRTVTICLFCTLKPPSLSSAEKVDQIPAFMW